jgi:hypothetical protein
MPAMKSSFTYFDRSISLLFALPLLLLGGAYLAYFAARTWQLLAFGYPLDYGEGPLLAQVALLRSGTPVWQIYADPQAPPYVVVNYPPLYLLLTAALSQLSGSVLLAGRLLSLFASLGCVAAIAMLLRLARSAGGAMPADPHPRRLSHTGKCGESGPLNQTSGTRLPGGREESATPLTSGPPSPARLAQITATATARVSSRQAVRERWLGSEGRARLALIMLLPLLFLTVPIVREWGTLLRVDMLGVCLGLWGLVALLQATTAPDPAAQRGWAAATVVLMVATLYVKPSLLAAPLAAGLWLAGAFLRGRQRIMAPAIVLSIGALGGLLFLALEWASGGWFALHVVTANANRWEWELARGFWAKQIELRWALGLAALLGLAGLWWHRQRNPPLVNQSAGLALLYTLAGAITAAGVGKVGAYDNYFLELYAGLVWLVCLALAGTKTQGIRLHSAICGLLAVSLLYYPPLWDANRLRPAGLVEPDPPRLAFGRYGLRQDQQREAAILAAQSRVYQSLVPAVRAAGPIIFTDMPGVAAAAGVTARVQLFEQRQMIDQGHWDEAPLLHELANGSLSLAVIDYLGNWMTPGMQTILQRRYAQDGPQGTFDMYRPVEAGPARSLAHDFGAGLPQLRAYRMPAANRYAPGELLPLSLLWQRPANSPAGPLEVVLRLEVQGRPLLENRRPLLYGVFAITDWPADALVEHMQPWQLPPELPPGSYDLTLSLATAEGTAPPALSLVQLTIAENGGRYFSETGFFVPADFLNYWETLGGIKRAGYPLTPAVPFAWGRLQCFERICLEERAGQVAQRALGARLYLAETIRSAACADASIADLAICPPFSELRQRFGPTGLGEPISGSMLRNGLLVQWTRYARLEQNPADGSSDLGRLGDDSLQLSPGQRYRWPE